MNTGAVAAGIPVHVSVKTLANVTARLRRPVDEEENRERGLAPNGSAPPQGQSDGGVEVGPRGSSERGDENGQYDTHGDGVVEEVRRRLASHLLHGEFADHRPVDHGTSESTRCSMSSKADLKTPTCRTATGSGMDQWICRSALGRFASRAWSQTEISSSGFRVSES